MFGYDRFRPLKAEWALSVLYNLSKNTETERQNVFARQPWAQHKKSEIRVIVNAPSSIFFKVIISLNKKYFHHQVELTGCNLIL